jgi:hypothetical protein
VSEQKTCPTCGTEYPLSERFCPRDGTALRSSNTQDLLGSVVADRYHILKKLGEGGMGTVYLAEHVKMGRKSALKVMNPGMNTDPDAIARFNREASNASRLSHPNICGIYDFGETSEGLIYLAMEFIEGSSLTSLIEKGGSLPAPRAASIVHQTADALQVAHDAGIVHRDLKPDNIMVAKGRDGSDQVKVVDFGIAKASSSDAQKVTKTGLVVGTPEYMSPEQLAGDKLDGRSDIYSLGLVAFNCLTGTLPFPSNSAQEAMIMRLTDRPKTLAEMMPEKSWPETLQATLDKALARDAEDRYASAAQFGRDFAAAIADMPMTQAVEAGTMIVNAASAGAAAKDIAKTRVAPEGRPSANTMPMQAPAKKAAAKAAPVEVVKKSAMPMVLGGVGGLAVAAGLFWQFVLNKPAPTPTEPSAPVGQESQVAKVPDPTPTVTPGTETKAPDASPPRSDPVPLSKSGAATPTKTPGTTSTPSPNVTPVPTAPPSGPSAAEVQSRFDRWIGMAQDENTTPTQMRVIIAELETLRPSLRGIQLAESWYVQMLVYSSDSDRGACAAADSVLKLHQTTSRRELATITKNGLCR